MNEGQKHEMILETTHPSDAEEWYCPICGRRLLISWEPKFTKTVLAVGDDFSIHSGGKGGLRIGGAQIMPVNDPNSDGESLTPIEDARLALWEAWLEESDFENLWGDEDQ